MFFSPELLAETLRIKPHVLAARGASHYSDFQPATMLTAMPPQKIAKEIVDG
jgi:hypothetical protein